jgi:hypothetical protein
MFPFSRRVPCALVIGVTFGLSTLAVVFSIVLVALTGEGTSSRQGPGTQRMARRLEQLAQNANLFPDHPMNTEAVNLLRQRLKQTRDSDNEFDLRIKIALTLLRTGKSEESVQELLQLQRWVARRNIQLSDQLTQIIRDLSAIAYLRLGEQENCIAGHGADSCYLPIRGSGIHRVDRGSRGAIKILAESLNANPDDLSSRWLLNIAYMTLGEYPDKITPQWLVPSKTFESDYDIQHFADAAPALGLDVTGLSGGCIIEDFDGDGYLDIMASSWGLRDQLRYFHNNGDGSFSDRTQQAGLTGEVGGLNICQTDYNNDGHPDVLVLRGAWLRHFGDLPNSLLRNNGDGTFEDVTEASGLLSFHPTQVGAWGDYDNDGRVDLFIGNESDQQENHPCQLFRNNGDGTFTEVAALVGVATAGYVKGAAWGDFNNDGRLDLYVSRMGQPNLLYRNDGPKGESVSAVDRSEIVNASQAPSGAWSFTEVGRQAGVTEPLKSFATWVWDYDNDGWLDLFVAGFSIKPEFAGSLDDVVKAYLGLPHAGEYPRLFRNNHNGTFTDVTRAVKLNKALLTMGANFGDLDNDGFPDCYLGTGEPDLRTLIPNRMFRNDAGRQFQEVTTSGGFGHLQKGHGIAFGDIDNDGDQDIYEVMGGWYSGDVYQRVLYINPGHGNHWITLKLEGAQSNRMAIGTRIKVSLDTQAGGQDIYAIVSSGGSFGSSSLQQEIGLGRATGIRAVEIAWAGSGRTQIFRNIGMDQFIKIREGESHPTVLKYKQVDLSPETLQKKGPKSPHPH